VHAHAQGRGRSTPAATSNASARKPRSSAWTIEKILITHGHIDHAGATAKLARELGVPVEGPQEEDRFWIEGCAAEQDVRLPDVESFGRTAGCTTATP